MRTNERDTFPTTTTVTVTDLTPAHAFGPSYTVTKMSPGRYEVHNVPVPPKTERKRWGELLWSKQGRARPIGASGDLSVTVLVEVASAFEAAVARSRDPLS
jgi:hypothetical protein